jgi:hypothetical protein
LFVFCNNTTISFSFFLADTDSATLKDVNEYDKTNAANSISTYDRFVYGCNDGVDSEQAGCGNSERSTKIRSVARVCLFVCVCECVLINPIICCSTHMALLIVFKGIVGVDAYAVAYAWKQAGIAVCLCLFIYL